MITLAEDLRGEWTLACVRFEPANGSSPFDLFGPDPTGHLLFSEGRMVALITARERGAAPTEDENAVLMRTMMAYTGKYRVDGAALITTVDLAWHPDWLGNEQVRFVDLRGDMLTLTSPEQMHPALPGTLGRGVIRWLRTRS